MISGGEIPNILALIREQERSSALDGFLHFVQDRTYAPYNLPKAVWRQIGDLIDDYKSREGLE